ncbi:MAG: hypothetical protein FWB99_07640, partial [Treponema sp.]|nr:hypothetical protein [Treponema sp.]
MKVNFSALKAKLFSKKTGSKSEVSIREMDLLDHIEKIVEVSKEHGIDNCFSRAQGHFDYVTE